MIELSNCLSSSSVRAAKTTRPTFPPPQEQTPRLCDTTDLPHCYFPAAGSCRSYPCRTPSGRPKTTRLSDEHSQQSQQPGAKQNRPLELSCLNNCGRGSARGNLGANHPRIARLLAISRAIAWSAAHIHAIITCQASKRPSKTSRHEGSCKQLAKGGNIAQLPPTVRRRPGRQL